MAKAVPSAAKAARLRMATATASAWFSSGRLGAHPPASSAPYSKLARAPAIRISAALTRQPAATSEPGKRPQAAARREFAEEVGIALTPAELVFLGQQPLQDTGRSAMQFFYLCTRPISLGETVFNEEVGAFVEVGLDDFDSLVRGRTASIQSQARYKEAPDKTRPREITPAAFAAYSEPIMDAIRRSASAIRVYLDTEQIDAAIWTPATD